MGSRIAAHQPQAIDGGEDGARLALGSDQDPVLRVNITTTILPVAGSMRMLGAYSFLVPGSSPRPRAIRATCQVLEAAVDDDHMDPAAR
jgi:hypothetical protein